MGTKTQLKQIVQEKGLDQVDNADFDNKLNDSIQEKFDSVFKEGEAESSEEELSFSVNKEKTQNNISIENLAPETQDFAADDDAPSLSLGEASTPNIEISSESTNSNISFGEGSGSLNLVAEGESVENAAPDSEDELSFGALKEPTKPAMPIPTQTKMASSPKPVKEVTQPEVKLHEQEEDEPQVAPVVSDEGMGAPASEDETGEIPVPQFEENTLEHEEVPSPAPAFTDRPTSPAARPSQERVVYNFDQNELARLQSMLRELKADREDLLKQIHETQKELKVQAQENLTYKTRIEDSKIEMNVLVRRHIEELEEFKHQVKMSEHKKQEYEEKVKNYQKEFDRLGQKVRFEVGHVKKREKELESKLELLTMDSQSQIQSRDTKIMELKRKIDALEFNMENLTIQEAKAREDKILLEDKLNKIMKNLRGSIKILEQDIGQELSQNEKKDSDKNNF